MICFAINTIYRLKQENERTTMKASNSPLSLILKSHGFQLGKLLERGANNLDLIRLICACLVIYGHAFALVPDPAYPPEKWDPFTHLGYAGVYSASIAVKVFFFISGLVVTNSLLVKNSVSHYIIGRLFRIWPALVILLITTSLLIGPCLSHLEVTEYFSRTSVYRYLAGNLFMSMQGNLPGVFSENPLPSLVNGALWTLPYEIAAYLAILFLAVLGIFRHRTWCGFLFVLIVIDPFLSRPLIFQWIEPNPQFIFLPSCFAFGALMAVFKDRIVVSPVIAIISFALFGCLRTTRFGPLVFFFALFILLLYFSGLSWMQKIRLKADLSYGTFLWGFFIQQLLIDRFRNLSFPQNVLISLMLALVFGFLSWHLIERPSIRWGKRLADRWRRGDASPRIQNPSSPAIFP